MPSLETSIAFFLSALLLAAVPGPDNVFVMTHSALHGKNAGLLIVLGLCTGLIFHTALVAFGMAAVLRAFPLAFTALKIIGAGYLLWLAWQMFRSAPGHTDAPSAHPPPGSLYRRGVIMNLTNPKVSLFFLAFLPQFADPARGPIMPQILVLGTLFCLATILVFGAIALFASALARTLPSSKLGAMVLSKAAALVFVAIAVNLVLARIP